MAMNHATNSANKRLGPYVFAFTAAAIALSGRDQARRTDDRRAEDAKARAEIADKLLSRLANLYPTPPARRRLLP
jgi:hypothetical protein